MRSYLSGASVGLLLFGGSFALGWTSAILWTTAEDLSKEIEEIDQEIQGLHAQAEVVQAETWWTISDQVCEQEHAP